MAAGRKPGPVCSVRDAPDLADVTHKGNMSPFGPLVIGITFCQSQDHRLYASLSDALDRAVELTPGAVFCETGITFGDNLTVLIPSLFKVLKVGGGTDGADDLSKSSAKMIPVAQTATREELLASLGLDFLPKSIYWELDDSAFMFPVGLSKLHNACSKQGTVRDFEVEKAARELARAVGLLLHVILQRVARSGQGGGKRAGQYL